MSDTNPTQNPEVPTSAVGPLRIDIQDGGSGFFPISVVDATGDQIARFSYMKDAETFVAALPGGVTPLYVVIASGAEDIARTPVRGFHRKEDAEVFAGQLTTWAAQNPAWSLAGYTSASDWNAARIALTDAIAAWRGACPMGPDSHLWDHDTFEIETLDVY